MIACWRRLAGAILGFSFAFCASHSIGANAQEAGAGSPSSGACSGNSAAFDDKLSRPHWNGWGVDPSQHRFQSSDMARLAESDLPRLKLKWAFGFPGATRSVAQPTIVGGRVFIGSQGGKVYSLDAKSGCTYWEFDAGKGVRSAIVIGQRRDGWAAYFGDAGASVHSTDAVTGKSFGGPKSTTTPQRLSPARRRWSGRPCLCRSRHTRRPPAPGNLTRVAPSGGASSRSTRQQERCCGRRTRSQKSPSKARPIRPAFRRWGRPGRRFGRRRPSMQPPKGSTPRQATTTRTRRPGRRTPSSP
jgi:hypothetical protein